jgi:holliday junction DNA helicase RuvA
MLFTHNMISYLTGKILTKNKSRLTLLTQSGVGYEINMTSLTLNKLSEGQNISLHTYLKVSDSALTLYGFKRAEESRFFQLLLSVSGVGPKSAMNILSLGSIDDIKSAIARGDVKYLTTVQGMGKKTAERMVVELKSKVISLKSKMGDMANSGILVDVMEGLIAMGYSSQEAKETIKHLEPTKKTVERLMREALQILNK